MPKKPKISEDLIWAREVMLVYKNLGKLADPEVLNTSSMMEIHRWINADEKNKFKFITDTAPKAAAIIEKNAPKDVSDAVRDIDVRTITELQRCLSAAVKVSSSQGE